MKRYKLLLLAVVAALVTGCYSDDTNLDYKTLDLPVIDNPENDLALFVPNRAYKIKLADRLQITPNVVYKEMNDLSYRWVIDGKEVATTKDLDWECDMETNRVYCYFEIRRNSAGNSTIFPFSIELDQPYVTGYSLLVEKDGALRYDFISYTVAALYTFDYYENGAGMQIPFTGSNPRLEEYWSCEKASIVGKEMFLDDDPENCASFSGETLLQEMTLQQEFMNEEFPDNFRLKDFMHGGFVSYLLAEDGRVFQRKGSRIYYTGRFLNLPMQYNGKQINGVKFITAKYSEGYGLIYDQTEDGGRFLLVNFDYSTSESDSGQRSGQITEFPDGSAMSGITDYELIDGWFVKDAAFPPGPSSVMMLFRRKSDGKYYTREVKITYTSRTSSVEISEVYEEVYRELPEFGPDSKTCVIRVDGGSSYKSGYMFYTSASNPRKVLVKERTASAAPTEFHTFDSDVAAIVEGTMKSNNCYMLFALTDGTVMMYTTSNRNVGSGVNFLTFEEERVIEKYQIDGKIRWGGFKYGGFSNF